MAAVNFPNNPSVNDTHTSSGSTWKWDGGVWQRLGVAGPQGAQGVQGAAGSGGAAGAQGAQGVQGAAGSNGAAGAQGAQGHQGVQGAAGSATINNNADNRLITGSGTAGELNAEANITCDGTRLMFDDRKILLGTHAGYSNPSDDTFCVGYVSGYSNPGNHSISIGSGSGYSNAGDYSINLGKSSGYGNSGDHSINIGEHSGYSNAGEHSVNIGKNAGYQSGGKYSVNIGYNAGNMHSVNSNHNVAIGYEALKNEGSNKYCIGIGASCYLPIKGENTGASDNQLVIGVGHTAWIVGTKGYNIGFGITNPISKIGVEGTGDGTTGSSYLGDTASAAGLFLKTHSGSSVGLALGGRTSGGQYIQAAYQNSTVVSVRDLCINPYGGGVGIGTFAPNFGGNPGADTIVFGTSQIERLRINSSGNIGQGVTPSGWASAQAGDFYAYQVGSGMAIFGRGSGDEDRGGISCNYYHTASQQKYIGNGHAGRIYFEDGSIVFSNAAQNASGADQNMTLDERLRITSAGKVSIGNLSSPDSLLHIHDGSAGSIAASSAAKLTIESSASDYNVLQFLSPNTASQQIRFGDPQDNGAGYINYDHNNSRLTIGVNGPEKMRIDSNGYVGIKLSDPHLYYAKDLVVQAISQGGITVRSSSTTDTNYLMFADSASGNERYRGYIGYSHNTGSDGGEHMQFAASSGTGLMRFYADGLALSGETAASNRLNDYEEGEYIPTIVGSSGGSWTTANYRYMAYTKIGRMVQIQGYLQCDSESSPSGTLRISLPFAVGSLSHDAENGAITISMRAHGNTSTMYNVCGAVSGSILEIIAVAGNGTHNWVDQNDVGTSWNIRIGGCYIAT